MIAERGFFQHSCAAKLHNEVATESNRQRQCILNCPVLLHLPDNFRHQPDHDLVEIRKLPAVFDEHQHDHTTLRE